MNHDTGVISLRHRYWLILAILMGAGAMTLRAWLYRQPVNSDDIQYFASAHAMPASAIEDSPKLHHTELRIALLAMIRVPILLFGYSAAAFYTSVYLHTALFAVSLLLFCVVLSDMRAAVIVLLLWATSSICIEIDTRLLPDNVGTMAALFALTLLAWAGRLHRREPVTLQPSSPADSSDRIEPDRSTKRLTVCAVVAGLLLYAAFSMRATFAAYGLAGFGFALLSPQRRRLGAFLILGLALAGIAEILYVWWAYGDPLARWKILLGYGDNISASHFFQGYTWNDILWRYPRRLWRVGIGEFGLFVGGHVGALVWLVRCRRKANAAKLLTFVFAYGLIAFALTKFDPPVPFMRDKERYYAGVAPLFYLAVADLFLLITDQILRLGNRTRPAATPDAPPIRQSLALTVLTRGIVVAMVMGFLAIPIANVQAAIDSPHTVRNGNDNLFRIAGTIRRDQARSDRPKRLYLDWRTRRVMGLLLSPGNGWHLLTLTEESFLPGYLSLDWQRLSRNAAGGYLWPKQLAEYGHLIERYPILERHRANQMYVVDVYIVPELPIHRKIVDVSDRIPPGWNRYDRKQKKTLTMQPDEPIVVEGKDLVFTGSRPAWRRPPSGALPGGRFVQVELDMTSEALTGVAVRLYAWHGNAKKCTSYYLGAMYVDHRGATGCLWTFLEQPATRFRIALNSVARPPCNVTGLRVRLMDPMPQDTIPPERVEE